MTMSMAQGICEAQDRNVYGYDDLKKVITFLAVSEVSYLSKEYMENGTYETEEGADIDPTTEIYHLQDDSWIGLWRKDYSEYAPYCEDLTYLVKGEPWMFTEEKGL